MGSFNMGSGNQMISIASPGRKDWKSSAPTQDWHSSGNWSPAGVPNSGHDVFIAASSNPPVVNPLSSGTALVGKLTVENGGRLHLGTEGALTVYTGVVARNNAIISNTATASTDVMGSITQLGATPANNFSGGTFNNNRLKALVDKDAFVMSSMVLGQNLNDIVPTDTKFFEQYYPYLNPSDPVLVIAQVGSEWDTEDTGSTPFMKGITASTYAPDGTPTTPTDVAYNFSGVLNAGDFTVAATSAEVAADGQRFPAWLGNPYACAMDLRGFMMDNKLEEVAIWTNDYPYAGNGTDYPLENFTNFNLFGSIKNSHDQTLRDNDWIEPGQAFCAPFVMNPDTGYGLFQFKADYMVHQTQFRKTEKHRIWLNLKPNLANAPFTQVLIGYTGQDISALQGYDSRIGTYESEMFPVLPEDASIYAYEPTTLDEFGEMPLPEFGYWSKVKSLSTADLSTDAFPIGVTANQDMAWSVSLDTLDGVPTCDGIFADPNQPIYLIDYNSDPYSEEGAIRVVHDLRIEPYVFNNPGSLGEVDQLIGRFEIRFALP